MNNLNLRTITNSFQDVRLVSLASWRHANEFSPRDRGGPYVITQEGYDPRDIKMTPQEFVLGRSGKWLSIVQFYKLPVADRRQEFVFGTAAEIMQLMGGLPSKVAMFGDAKATSEPGTPRPDDEMAAAFQAAKSSQGNTPG